MIFNPPRNETLIFQVRPAHASDAHGFDAIFEDLNWFVPIGQNVSADSEVAFDLKYRFEEQIRLAQDSSLRSFYVAETASSDLIGYAAVYWLPRCNTSHPMAYLTDLYVLSQHREKPVGQALLDQVISEARSLNCDQIFTHRSRNSSHQGFFGNRNWEENSEEGVFILRL